MSPYWYLPESDFIVECFSHFCPLPLYCLIIRDCCILFYFHVSGVKSAISLSHVSILNMLRKASSVNRQTWATSRVQMFTLCCPPYVDSFFLFFFLLPLASSTYSGKNTVDVNIIYVLLMDLCCEVYKSISNIPICLQKWILCCATIMVLWVCVHE